MRIPLGWLQDFIDIDLPVDEFARVLTIGGLEVKAIERVGADWSRDAIYVAEVRSVRPHPNADRLVLVTVDYGQDAPLEVVTGAPNLRVGDRGQRVVFATVGARLIDPYAETLQYKTLKRSKIRGVASEGMVCSERELGLSDEHEGILILPDDAPVGTPLADYLGDTVLDLDLTPNLARCFSMVGTARDAAALTGLLAHIQEPTLVAEGGPIAGRIQVAIEDPDLCARYSAALITGVRIGPSPLWMQRRLRLAGMRPINNVVDITNYVMLEWGQPLHAFDYHRLRARPGEDVPAIIVRRAYEGERMRTLDGVERTFNHQNLLITDGGGPVAVAGIMGGEESEVTADTTDVLLEAASFHFLSVRRTSGELKIPSESALRFGRGVDPELTVVALRRAAELMRALAGGTVAEGLADAYPQPLEPPIIDLPAREVRRVLGIALEAEDLAELLRPLGFGCDVIAGAEPLVRVTVPSFRLDVRIVADLLEEVARMVGYDRLPETLMAAELPAQRRNLDVEAEDRVRDVLVGCGLTETIGYSLTNLESVARLTPGCPPPDAESYVRLANPLSREHEFMRQTLMNTSLETMARNLRFGDRAAIYEIARVYLPAEGQELPAEPTRLSIGLAGWREPRSWLSPEPPPYDFYDLKGILETLCTHLGVEGVTCAPVEHPTFHPGRVAHLLVEGTPVGVLGEVHPQVRGGFDLPEQPVYLAEVELAPLLERVRTTQRFAPVSRMPVLREDIAIIVDEATPSDAIADAIREAGSDLLVDVVLFDVYRGAQIGEGRKSLAYSLSFQSPDKTLTSEQSARMRQRIVQRLEEAFGAVLRG